MMNKIVTALLLTVIVLTSCSPKEQARFSSGTAKSYMGLIPSDICKVDGVPMILGTNMDESDVTLTYVRNNGDIVMRLYLRDLVGTQFIDSGEFYWMGGNCPSEVQ